MSLEAASLDHELLNHFSVLIYPFLHEVTANDRGTLLQRLDARWEPWWSRLTDGQLPAALGETSFFLPYVRGLLFPETVHLQEEAPGDSYTEWALRLRQWSGSRLDSFSQRLSPDAVLRLTCRAPVLAALADFELVQRREAGGHALDSTKIAARFDWVDAVLFPTGIGFLLLKVRLREKQPRLATLIELNGGLRSVRPPTLSWKLPVLRFAATRGDAHVSDVMDFLGQGMTGGADGALSRFVSFRGPDPKQATPFNETEPGRAYGGRCLVLSYACLHLAADQRRRPPNDVFRTAEDQLLFEYAACIGPGDPVHNATWAPSEDQADRLRRKNRLALWRCWKGMALKESLVFLGVEDLPFNRSALPRNIESAYLPLYLFTLYQKYQLFTFANSMTCEVAHAGGNLDGARSLLHRFVAFRNRFWVSEVTQKPQGCELYRKLQHGLEVGGLYEMMNSSVREAKEYYQELRDRQVQLALNLLTLVFGPLMVLCDTLHLLLENNSSLWEKALRVAALMIGAAAVLLVVRKAMVPRQARIGGASGRRSKATKHRSQTPGLMRAPGAGNAPQGKNAA